MLERENGPSDLPPVLLTGEPRGSAGNCSAPAPSASTLLDDGPVCKRVGTSATKQQVSLPVIKRRSSIAGAKKRRGRAKPGGAKRKRGGVRHGAIALEPGVKLRDLPRPQTPSAPHSSHHLVDSMHRLPHLCGFVRFTAG